MEIDILKVQSIEFEDSEIERVKRYALRLVKNNWFWMEGGIDKDGSLWYDFDDGKNINVIQLGYKN